MCSFCFWHSPFTYYMPASEGTRPEGMWQISGGQHVLAFPWAHTWRLRHSLPNSQSLEQNKNVNTVLRIYWSPLGNPLKENHAIIRADEFLSFTWFVYTAIHREKGRNWVKTLHLDEVTFKKTQLGLLSCHGQIIFRKGPPTIMCVQAISL